jgi:peptidyl-prolyl cis-trans isomerase B (cyclophilin B)
MNRLLLVLGILALALFVVAAACEKKASEAQQQGQAVQGQAAQATGEKTAVIETNKGVIKFKFFEHDAPNTAANFIKLADKKFYDGLLWHRVEPGFVIQGGDPNGNGTGGPGYSIKAEFNKNPHLDGTVAMARAADPNSAGSQFYICLAALPSLDGQYTVFGQVTEGLDVVHKIVVGDKMLKVYIENK